MKRCVAPLALIMSVLLVGCPPEAPGTRVSIPPVAGMSRAAADAALTTAGLATGVVTDTWSDTVPEGCVISQDPTAGTLVARGSRVNLVISLGKEPPTQAVNPSDYYAFESGPVRPVALTPDKQRLVVANIPDGQLEVFRLDASGAPTWEQRIPVGMEPVAVAARTNSEIWVVNQLSDSVSIVDIGRSPGTTVRTLLVGDEPHDIVFAGPHRSLAFITTAHRGQHRTHASILDVPGAGDPKLTTPGTPRADVWVFDAANLGTALGGKPKRIIELFGDTPRALATNADGTKVYAAIFHSGNQTTVVHDGVVPDSPSADPGESSHPAEPEVPANLPPHGLNDGRATLPGGMMLPLEAYDNLAPAIPIETGLIVKWDNEKSMWYDNHGIDSRTGREVPRNWNYGVRFTLPDYDVLEIDATSPDLPVAERFPHVGTILYNMAVNPATGKVFVSNSEANNFTRYAGPPYEVYPGAPPKRTYSAETHYMRVTVIDPATGAVRPRHLNKHIDYTLSREQMWATDTKHKSLAIPLDMVFSADGETLYLTAFGSSKIGVFDPDDLEDDTFTPGDGHIPISGGGPCGVVLDESRGRLYVATRFDNGISVVDTQSSREISHHLLRNPEPPSFRASRPLLYDALTYSENGEASCASCHVFGGWDSLAWDLGMPFKKPDVSKGENTIAIHNEATFLAAQADPGGPASGDDPIWSDPEWLQWLNGNGDPRFYNTMPGPMITPSWKGIQNHGHFHWRGDTVNRAEADTRAVVETPDGYRNNQAVCFEKDNPIDYDEVLSLRNLTTAHPGFNGNHLPKVTADDMERFGDFIFELMQPPNPVRSLDNSMTPAQARGKAYYFGTMDPAQPDRVVHHASGYEPLHWAEDPQPFYEGEPVGFTCNDCHRVSPEHGFYGTDGNCAPSGEMQIMKTAQLRNMYAKVGMFGIPDREGWINYPGSNSHRGDQVRGYGYQSHGATDTLFNYLHGSVFANDKKPDVGFRSEQQRTDMEQYLLAFPNDLAPIVGQQITVSGNLASQAVLERVTLMETRASSTWDARECGGSKAEPVTECDLIVRGVVSGQVKGYRFDPKYGEYVPAGGGNRLTHGALIQLARTGENCLTFTCAPPGAGIRRLK